MRGDCLAVRVLGSVINDTTAEGTELFEVPGCNRRIRLLGYSLVLSDSNECQLIMANGTTPIIAVQVGESSTTQQNYEFPGDGILFNDGLRVHTRNTANDGAATAPLESVTFYYQG